ncbi:MAG: hydantoinase/oxoprolinase family protein [Chloroflexota bacterium]
MSFRIAIDCGGTFTDGISVDAAGVMVTAKARTTPEDLTIGIRNTLESLAQQHQLDLSGFMQKTSLIVHGTTVGTNTLLTRSGPRTGVITTQGYRDIIEFRNIPKANMYDWRMPCPEPLAPRYYRVEVTERLDRKGEVKTPLDEESVRKAVAHLKKEGVQAIAVTLLFSFLNPAHENRVAEIVKEEYPEAYVALSSQVIPIIGEFERTSTTLISAYISGAVNKYLAELEKMLKSQGFKGELLIMQNNGGVETAEIAIEKPATIASSGPAAGPIAASIMGQLHNEKNLISVDMGGTSFDVGVISNGVIPTKPETLLSDIKLALPVIDVTAIGAGGGSIAWIDVANTLRVGPRSAGAVPGPACYGTGGQEATVTDADVILGYISPDFFLGGEMPLRKDLSEQVVAEKVGKPLGLNATEAAAAIYKVINAGMADAVSYAFTRRGYDPRDFTLSVGGAAGPVHGVRIMQELGIAKLLITKMAPIYCAFGMLGVDMKHDFTRFYYAQGHVLDLERVKQLYDEMEKEALETLERQGVSEEMRSLERYMKLRYFGQFRELEVPWPGGPITPEAINAGVAAFHAKHKELFGSSNENYPLEYMSFGLTAIGRVPNLKFKKAEHGGADPSAARKGERDAYFEESSGFIKTAVYDGDLLRHGNILEGPCVVEEKMTSIVIPPGFKMTVDEHGNYISL